MNEMVEAGPEAVRNNDCTVCTIFYYEELTFMRRRSRLLSERLLRGAKE